MTLKGGIRVGIVVKNIRDGKHYALIGTGYGAFKTSHPSVFGGSFFPHYEGGNCQTAAVCDKEGKIYWCDTKDLEVITIDENKPDEILENYIDEIFEEKEKGTDSEDKPKCPTCGSDMEDGLICTNCGTNHMGLL